MPSAIRCDRHSRSTKQTKKRRRCRFGRRDSRRSIHGNGPHQHGKGGGEQRGRECSPPPSACPGQSASARCDSPPASHRRFPGRSVSGGPLRGEGGSSHSAMGKAGGGGAKGPMQTWGGVRPHLHFVICQRGGAAQCHVHAHPHLLEVNLRDTSNPGTSPARAIPMVRSSGFPASRVGAFPVLPPD